MCNTYVDRYSTTGVGERDTHTYSLERATNIISNVYFTICIHIII